MGKFWRTVNKIMFWISFSVLEIAVIVLAIGAGTSRISLSWLIALGIFVGGTILVLVIHSFWGIVLSMFDDIAAIRRNTSGQGNGAPQQMAPAAPQYQVTAQYAQAPVAQPVYSAPVYAQAPAQQYAPAPEEADGMWFCPSCGTKNSPSAFCKSCGTKKPM